MALANKAEPVRMYSDDDARLPVRLSKVLQDRIESLSETVLDGQLNEKDYRFFTGQIFGLRQALSECDRIATELNGN